MSVDNRRHTSFPHPSPPPINTHKNRTSEKANSCMSAQTAPQSSRSTNFTTPNSTDTYFKKFVRQSMNKTGLNQTIGSFTQERHNRAPLICQSISSSIKLDRMKLGGMNLSFNGNALDKGKYLTQTLTSPLKKEKQNSFNISKYNGLALEFIDFVKERSSKSQNKDDNQYRSFSLAKGYRKNFKLRDMKMKKKLQDIAISRGDANCDINKIRETIDNIEIDSVISSACNSQKNLEWAKIKDTIPGPENSVASFDSMTILSRYYPILINRSSTPLLMPWSDAPVDDDIYYPKADKMHRANEEFKRMITLTKHNSPDQIIDKLNGTSCSNT